MKSLLSVTAILEALTGMGLIVAPSFVVTTMLGSSFDQPTAIVIARIAGAALVTLAIACWLTRNNAGASGVVKAMLFYNVAVSVLLMYASFAYGFAGTGLWPAVLVHAGLLGWCLKTLRK